MNHFTQPQPVNVNETKRMIGECFSLMLSGHAQGFDENRIMKMIWERLDEINITGDDS